MAAVSAKAALLKALPGISKATTKAHVQALVASDHFDKHGSYDLEVPDGLAGQELADYVLGAFPSLGFAGKD